MLDVSDMIQHLLIAVDGSPSSHHAANQGFGLARQTNAKVTLAYVLEAPPVIPVGPLSGYVMTAPPRTDADLERARAELQSLAREAKDVPVETRVELGVPADVICELAERLSVDLVVVGARGLNAGTRWLMGSVSDCVVHHAPCPVLVVRERKR
jgi:nucleotide-binding universal stress UspA family protein